MTEHGRAPPHRRDRRKAQTRAALVRAAQAFLRAGKTDVPILEITQAADVGMGSFYNHFDSKEQLFQAAVEDALDAHGALLDELTAGIDDPAEVFARSFRLTGRLHRRQPDLSKVLLRHGLAIADLGQGPRPPSAPRHRRGRPCGPVQRRRRRPRDDDRRRRRPRVSASSCTTIPTATTPTPPTRSPRTCCACSVSRPAKRARSAGRPLPTLDRSTEGGTAA